MKTTTRGNPNASKPDEENPYWISFSDIMSGLLIIFILASMVLIFELTKTKVTVDDAIREIIKAETIRQTIVTEIKRDLHKAGVEVEVTDNHTVIRIPDELLSFETNRYRIPPRPGVKQSVAMVAKALYASITKEDRWKYLDTIFVEGHTDRRNTRREMGNLGLSTFRAISVWNHWEASQPRSDRLSELRNHRGAPLFSVSGYGATRPITASQDTEEDLRQNRRIDIRFTVKQPVLEEFKHLLDLMK